MKKTKKNSRARQAQVKKIVEIKDTDELDEALEDSNIVKAKYRTRYEGKGKSNRHCSDQLAIAIKDMVYDVVTLPSGRKKDVFNEEALHDLASENGLTLERWAHLNLGQQRMCLGNMLRGHFKRGGLVLVDDASFKGENYDRALGTAGDFDNAKKGAAAKHDAKQASKLKAIHVAEKGRQPKSDNPAYTDWLGKRKDNKAMRIDWNTKIKAA